MKPFVGAIVLVNVQSGYNNGSPLAPAIVTAVGFGASSVNVHVSYDGPVQPPDQFRLDWITSVPFHDAEDPLKANERGVYGAFWPPEATE